MMINRLIGRFLFVCFFLINLQSNASVTITQAAGWTNLCTSFITQTGNIIITEGGNSDFPENQSGATLILTAPSGYEFDVGIGTISFSGTSPGSADLTAISMTVASTTITITLSTDASAGKTDVITVTGLRAKASLLTPPAVSGSILRTAGNKGTLADIPGITNGTTNFGTLTQTNLSWSSCTTAQSNSNNVAQGTTNNQMIDIQVIITGTCGSISITSFTFNTNGSNAPATNITNAKLWYTGTSSSFATTSQVGATFTGPSGSFIINSFAQTLSSGTNYFWLTYDVPAGATSTQFLDAECNSITLSDVGAKTPSVQAPGGTRTIGISIVTSIASGAWSNTSTWDCTCIPNSSNHVVITSTHAITTTANIACVNLTINGSGSLAIGAFELNILGTGPVLGASLTSICTSKLKISDIGDAAQFIFPTSLTLLNKLTVNRTTGATSNHDINLANCAPAVDSVVLVLINGVLFLTPSGTSKLLMSNATYGKATRKDIPCSNTAYVDGIVQRSTTGVLDEMYVFPVGNNGISRKFAVGGGSADVANDVQFFRSTLPNSTCIASALIGGVKDSYYWTNTRASGTCQRRIYYEYSDFGMSAAQRATDLTTADATMATIPDPGCAIANTWSKSTGGITIYDASNYLQFDGSNASNSKYWAWGSIGVPIATLPIELLSFTAKSNDQNIVFTWTTATETNNDYFTLERSKNAIDFEVVCEVNGAGNSSSLRNYSYVSNNPTKDFFYYRLKQTDYDGNYTYSNLITMEFSNKSFDVGCALEIFPNPAENNNFTINLKGADTKEEVLIVVYDAMGKEYFAKIIMGYTNQILINGSEINNQLASGIYYIIASNKKIYERKKLIINK